VFTSFLKAPATAGDYGIVFGGAFLVLALLSASYIWALINIVLPICNLVFPNVQYIEAVNRLQNIESKQQKNRVFRRLLVTKQSILFLVLYLGLFYGMHSVYRVLLTGYLGEISYNQAILRNSVSCHVLCKNTHKKRHPTPSANCGVSLKKR